MIRRGTINDVQLLQSIGRKTFQDTFGNTCTKEDMKGVLERYFNTAQCETELQDPQDNFFFQEEDGFVKGYMRINTIYGCPMEVLKPFHCVELVRLYVLNDYHGLGVADELMNFAVAFAKEKGFDRMYLSVWEYNFRARRFYEKHGFVNSGIENDFPLGTTPQTDLWFVKEIECP